MFTQIFQTLKEIAQQKVRFSHINRIAKNVRIVTININKKQAKNIFNICSNYVKYILI